MSFKKIFRRGSKREDAYKVDEYSGESEMPPPPPSSLPPGAEDEEKLEEFKLNEDKKSPLPQMAKEESGEAEEKKEREVWDEGETKRKKSGGEEQKKELPVYHSFRRDVFTFFDIPTRHTVDNLMNKCIPEWLRYLTKEHFQAKDLIPCEYRLGAMHFDPEKFWFSFRLKQCATEEQRRAIEKLFGCQEGNYQLCDQERVNDMNHLITLQSDGGGMGFMKSLKTMNDEDILKMEAMRKGKMRMEERYSDGMYTITEDSYACFTIWTKDGPWRKFLKKYDFDVMYYEDNEVYEQIVEELLETPSVKILKAIDKEKEATRNAHGTKEDSPILD